MKGQFSVNMETSEGFKTFSFDFIVPWPDEDQCEYFVRHNCGTCLLRGLHDCTNPALAPDDVCDMWSASVRALVDGAANYYSAIQAIHNGGGRHE